MTKFKKNLKKVLLVYRPDTPEVMNVAKVTKSKFKSKGIELYTLSGQAIDSVTKTLPTKEVPDLILAVGGDGTYLRATRALPDQQKR